MITTLKVKQVSYGLIEVVDQGITTYRYALLENGVIKEQSNDLQYIIRAFEKR